MDIGTWQATIHSESEVAQSCPTLCDPYGLTLLTSLVAQMVKRLSTMQETQVQALGWEDPLEKEMAIHSSTIAWENPM